MKKYILIVLAFAALSCQKVVIQHGPVTVTEPADRIPSGEGSGLQKIDAPLSKDLLYSHANLQTTTAVMQSFDLDLEENLIYYTQLNSNYRLYFCWGNPNAEAVSATMELYYFGHGSNFTVEKAGSELYLWIGNMATKTSAKEYWYDQVVSRVRITAGAKISALSTTDNYYFGEQNISVAVDFDNDRLTILGISTGRVRTYSLSQLMALPVEDIVLDPITYGGDGAPDASERTETPVVRARDCRKVDPIGDFYIARGQYPDGTSISWQGFDVCDGLIYQAQGNGNSDGKSPSNAFLCIYGIDGNIIQEGAHVAAVEDVQGLARLEITDSGFMEPEGVKIRNGVMYLGYASKSQQGIRRAAIFNYSPAPLK